MAKIKKMQAGGVTKSAKRVGPVDPNGAYTKVQERTLAGAKAPKVPLVKDKELDATPIERKQAGAKMKNGGKAKLGSGARFAALKSKIQSKGKSAKAALAYNDLLVKWNLVKSVPKILHGQKIKWVY